MTARGLADTSIFIARESGRSIAEPLLPESLAVSIVTIAELRAGVLIAPDSTIRARRLETLTAAASMTPLPIDDSVAQAWARLRVALREREMRMPVNDSWIAATASAHGVPVVTHDSDYVDLPDVEVIRV